MCNLNTKEQQTNNERKVPNLKQSDSWKRQTLENILAPSVACHMNKSLKSYSILRENYELEMFDSNGADNSDIDPFLRHHN